VKRRVGESVAFIPDMEDDAATQQWGGTRVFSLNDVRFGRFNAQLNSDGTGSGAGEFCRAV
jgi:hypothetical protein